MTALTETPTVPQTAEPTAHLVAIAPDTTEARVSGTLERRPPDVGLRCNYATGLTEIGMELSTKDDVHRKNMMTETGQSRPPGGAPDPVGLAVAEKIQERLRPAEVILLGSRAAGDHRPDSDVDLMAVCADEAAVRKADETLRQLLEGKYEMPVVNVVTITEKEFVRTAPLGQSYAGQAVRHGVTPDGKPPDYRPEREPEPEEIREAAVFWLYLAETHLQSFDIAINSEHEHLRRSDIPAFQGQTALERAFKGLLAAGNDGTRFRRDAAVMWRHIKESGPITDRKGAEAMENLLAATMGPDGSGCSLTRFTEARRREDFAPDPTEAKWQAMNLHLALAVGALVTEALARSGATWEELQQERNRRKGRGR